MPVAIHRHSTDNQKQVEGGKDYTSRKSLKEDNIINSFDRELSASNWRLNRGYPIVTLFQLEPSAHVRIYFPVQCLSLTVKSVRYTRGSFIFPGAQTYPHRSFTEEVAVLDSYFGKLESGSEAYIMGGLEDQKWHVYTASAEPSISSDPVYTLDMCMTSLDREKASIFYKIDSRSDAMMTINSGIRKILPESENLRKSSSYTITVICVVCGLVKIFFIVIWIS